LIESISSVVSRSAQAGSGSLQTDTDMNYIGQTGISIAQIALEALRRAGRDLTVDSLVSAMESLHEFTDLYGNTYSFGPNQHHGLTKAFLAVVKDGRWVPVVDKPLGY
jgi:branched-chain amino acid transport system substrate-binding protein